MGINYTAANTHAQFWRKNVVPHLQHLTGPMTFSDYLSAIYKSQVATKTHGLPSPVIYSLDFLSRYKDRCLTFLYNSPEEIGRGASPISSLYQLSPSLHCLANISIWHEEGEGVSDGHITTYLVYEHLQEVLDFMDKNEDIIKKESSEKAIGFNLKSSLS